MKVAYCLLYHWLSDIAVLGRPLSLIGEAVIARVRRVYMKIRVNPFFIRNAFYIPIRFNSLLYWHLSNNIYSFTHKESKFPNGVSFIKNQIESISARDAFLCAGYLMSTTSSYSASRNWGFFIEHIESISDKSHILRISDELKDVDERIRTLFVEKFAVGLAGWLLWRNYKVIHIADASYFINKTIYNNSSIYHKKGLLYGKGGKLKPDYFCLTSNNECVIAESKGGIGSPSILKEDFSKGKKQVQNVNPFGVNLRANANRLVFGMNIRYESDIVYSGKDTSVLVLDPNENEDTLNIEIKPEDIIFNSYGKFFSFCGLNDITKYLIHQNEPILSIELDDKNIIKTKNFDIFPILQFDNFVIGLQIDIARLLFRRDIRSLLDKNLFTDNSMETDTESLFLPNGIFFGFV